MKKRKGDWTPPSVLRQLADRFGCGDVFHGRTWIGGSPLTQRRRVLLSVVDDVEIRLVFGKRVHPLVDVEWFHHQAPDLGSFRLPPSGPEGWAERVKIDRHRLFLELDRPGAEVSVDELERGIRWLAKAANTAHREMTFLRALPGAVPYSPTPGDFHWSFHEAEFASGHRAWVRLPTQPPVRAWPAREAETIELRVEGDDLRTVTVGPPLDAARVMAAAEELARRR